MALSERYARFFRLKRPKRLKGQFDPWTTARWRVALLALFLYGHMNYSYDSFQLTSLDKDRYYTAAAIHFSMFWIEISYGEGHDVTRGAKHFTILTRDFN